MKKSLGGSQKLVSSHTILYIRRHTEVFICTADTPAKAKQLGREVKGFKQDIWDKNCDAVVEEGSYQKFKQNEKLLQVLLETGERQLVETSPNDRLWGIGFNSDDAEGNEHEWGQNKLGKALERARKEQKRALYHLNAAQKKVAKRIRIVIEPIQVLDDAKKSEENGWTTWIHHCDNPT